MQFLTKDIPLIIQLITDCVQFGDETPDVPENANTVNPFSIINESLNRKVGDTKANNLKNILRQQKSTEGSTPKNEPK